MDKKKFDIRIFALITRLDPLEVYMAEEGYIYYAKEKYKKYEEIN